MTQKRIVWRDTDNYLCITHPAPQSMVPEAAGMTEDEYIAWVLAKSLPRAAQDAVTTRVVDLSEAVTLRAARPPRVA